MYDAEQRMQEIVEAPQLTAVEKASYIHDRLNRFFILKNKMNIPVPHPSHEAPVQTTPPETNEPDAITPRVPTLLNLISLLRHQQKRDDQNSSAIFFTTG
jgi:hypothetical protein